MAQPVNMRPTLPNDRYTYVTPLTPEELVRLRNAAVDLDNPEGDFTCNACEHAAVCTEVFDEWNQFGDCILDK